MNATAPASAQPGSGQRSLYRCWRCRAVLLADASRLLATAPAHASRMPPTARAADHAGHADAVREALGESDLSAVIPHDPGRADADEHEAVKAVAEIHESLASMGLPIGESLTVIAKQNGAGRDEGATVTVTVTVDKVGGGVLCYYDVEATAAAAFTADEAHARRLLLGAAPARRSA